MAFSEVFPLEVVRKNALQIYQIQLTNWGNTGTGADPFSLVSPIFDFSLAGLAIDPESLITSVIVRPVQGGVLNPSGFSQPTDFIVTKENPFTGRLTFPRRPPFNGQWGLVAFEGDRYSDSMRNKDAVVANFGGLIPEFRRPDLKLIMYIDAAPPAVSVPKRNPRQVSYQLDVNDLTPGQPVTLTIEPISGRRLVRVTCATIIGNGHTFQFRGISPGLLNQPGPPPVLNLEFAGLAPDLVTPAPGTIDAVKSQVIANPTCHYLHVTMAAVAPAPGQNVGTVSIDMYD